MTAPAEEQVSPEIAATQQLIEEHAAAVHALEIAAVASAIGTVAQATRMLTAGLVARWVTAFGGLDTRPGDSATSTTSPAGIVAWLAKQIGGLVLWPSLAIREYGPQARVLGARQAREEANLPRPRGARPPTLSEIAASAGAAQDEKVAALLADAVRLVRAAEVTSYRDLVPAISQVQHAVSATQSTVMWAVHHEANEGIRDEARRTSVDLLWVGERDACVHCLAYFGEIGTLSAGFRLGLTFGEKPLTPWPDEHELPSPPLHPRCRCRMQLWLGGGQAGLRGFPDVLRHEAQRSVLKGWKLPSESERTRLDAAKRLLAQRPDLPKSVVAEARRAVETGKFRTTTVPD